MEKECLKWCMENVEIDAENVGCCLDKEMLINKWCWMKWSEKLMKRYLAEKNLLVLGSMFM